MKTYVNPQKIETLITIRLWSARTWLRKLGYVYKDVGKDMFIDKHEQSDVVEDCLNFLKKIEELKPYIVQFNKDGIMKPKACPPNCVVKSENKLPIIVITQDECTFSTNDGIKKAWT